MLVVVLGHKSDSSFPNAAAFWQKDGFTIMPKGYFLFTAVS